jgi:hypothetical protein
MKKPFKNIISIVLLGFYLAGFCGIHLLKHQCSCCEQSSIQIAQSSSSLSTENLSECCQDEAIQKDSVPSSNCAENSYCCDYEIIYLKSDPETTLSKENKAPIANESILFIPQIIKLLKILAKSINPEPTAYLFHQQSETDLNRLCTYRC